MESTRGKVRYVVYSNVTKVEKVGLGYFVHFLGSHELIYVGEDVPDMRVGDKVRITMEKVDANT